MIHMHRKALFVTLMVLMLVPAISAQTMETTADAQVDTVILASTENYPDALVAGSAAAKLGVPVLLTDKEGVPQETQDILEQMNPNEIILAGGEEVISAEVAAALESDGYEVTRLWGTTRYGTAVEVAEHFWVEGADEAVIVQNSLQDANGDVLAEAKELARDDETPVYLTPEETVPAVVLNSLQGLDVSEVTVIGTDVSSEYQAEITELGIEIDEVITGEQENDVEQQLRDRMTERLNRSHTMLVVASSRFQHRIASSNFPDHHVYHVSQESDIQSAVDVVNDNGVENVKIVGEPDLAEQAGTTLNDETGATVEVHARAGAAASVNAEMASEEREHFAAASKKRMERWEQHRQERMAHVQQRANKSINKADDLIDENASEDARDELQDAREAYADGDYFEAWEDARDAINTVREDRFRERHRDRAEAIREAMEEETESLQERVEDIRELNQEFAEEMAENMTTEERLEVIEEFRHERRETVEDMVDDVREADMDLREDIRERLENVQERMRDREQRHRDESSGERVRFKAECTDSDAEPFVVTEHRVTGHDGRVRADGTLVLPTPNYAADASVEETGDRELAITITLSERDGIGIQCLGEAEYLYEVDREPGNWTVDFTMTAGGDTIHSETTEVAVRADDSRNDSMETETTETSESTEPETHDVTYTSDGFSPEQLTINQGDTVVWQSEGPSMSVASDNHPTHTEYDGTSRSEHCSDGASSTFDQCESGETYRFTFDQTGEWQYHNHDNAVHGGVVIVE